MSADRLSQRARGAVVADLVIATVVIAGPVTWDLVGTLPLPSASRTTRRPRVIVGLKGLRLLRSTRGGPPAGPVRSAAPAALGLGCEVLRPPSGRGDVDPVERGLVRAAEPDHPAAVRQFDAGQAHRRRQLGQQPTERGR